MWNPSSVEPEPLQCGTPLVWNPSSVDITVPWSVPKSEVSCYQWSRRKDIPDIEVSSFHEALSRAAPLYMYVAPTSAVDVGVITTEGGGEDVRVVG